MDTMSAFVLAQANKNNEMKVFDWVKAAEILKERKPHSAIAGLSSDMEWTSGTIWENGEPIPKDETYTYLASVWATPVLEIDGEEIPCFKMQSEVPAYNAETYWPEDALAVIKAA